MPLLQQMLNFNMHVTVWKYQAEISLHSFCHILNNITEILIKLGKFAFQSFKTEQNRDYLFSKYATFSVKLTSLTTSLTHNNKNNIKNNNNQSWYTLLLSFTSTLNSM